MRVSKRILSCILAAVMLVSVCFSSASCKKKSGAVKKVSESDPWYNATRVELDPGFDPELYNAVMQTGPFMCHDKFVMTYFVLEKAEFNGSPIELTNNLMGIFDRDGKLLNMIDLYDYMDEEKSEIPLAYQVMGFCESEKGIRLYFTDPYFVNAYYLDIDAETGLKVGSKQKFDISMAQDPDQNGSGKDYYSFRDILLVEGYEVITFYNSDFTRTKLGVAKDSQMLYCIDFEKEFGPGEGARVFDVTGIGNGKVMYDSYGKTHFWGELDLLTGKVNKVPEGRSVPTSREFSSTREGKGYITKATGIYEYNPETGEETLFINFDHCNINRNESQISSVISCDEDKVIIACQPGISERYLLPPSPVVYTLEKAEKNPNAGKTIITVASLSDYLSQSEAEALQVFNEQNSEYYAQLILYGQNDFLSAGEETYDIDNSDRQKYSAMAMASGSLILDIRSGMAPDVILGAAQTVDLLDSSYLMDLTPYLKSKSFDSSQYYSKIIDAAAIDGKTYYIPTSFTLTGIATDGSGFSSDRNGFTYEQYASFVKEQLNGVEPVTEKSSRMHFLNLCVQNNYAQWLKDGKIDFNQDGFRELAGFFRDNIPEGRLEQKRFWDIENTQYESHDAVFLEELYCLSMFANADYYGGKIRFMGLPSATGTGPSARIYYSFSITADSPVEDGAYAFLDILLSEDVQAKQKDSIPINRAASAYKCGIEKADNLIGYKRIAGFTPDLIEVSYQEDLRVASLYDPATKLDEIYLEMLEGVDSILIPDNSVLMIVSEEMPPYFIDQKNIDDVITTINSRTQVVFDER